MVTAKSPPSHLANVRASSTRPFSVCPVSDRGEHSHPAGQDFVDAIGRMIGEASEKLPQVVAGRPRADLYFRQALVGQLRRGERCFLLLVTVCPPVVGWRGLKVANRASLGFGAPGLCGRALGAFAAVRLRSFRYARIRNEEILDL